MNGSFSTWLEQQLLAHTFGNVAYPRPAGLFVALYTTMPTQGGGGVECAASGYTRMSTAFGAITGAPPSMSNSGPVQWPAAPSNWGAIVAAGIFDRATAGNFLGSAGLVDPSDLTTPMPKIIGQGDAFRIPAGALVVGFALAATGGVALSASALGLIGAEVVS
jgi:hypothetical protein